MIKIYCDGACKNNPGPGGWGAVIVYDSGQIAQHCGYVSDLTTNNACEMMALIEGLKRVDPATPIEVCSDSKYVLDAITKKWINNWKRNNWLTAKKTPVANKELWIRIIDMIKGRDITWTWVKGHSGDVYNEMADKLANLAISEKRKAND
jgi:ribonuclease HI